MSTPLVTIITPTHDRPAMFSECAAAVLAQTFTDWVWWVVFNVSESDVFRWEGPLPHAYDWRVFDDSRIVPVYYPLVDNFMRKSIHVPARIVNWLYPKVTTPYIYFLADDDLIDAEGLGVLVKAFEEEYEWRYDENMGFDLGHRLDSVYGRCEVVDQQADGSYAHACWCYEHGDVGLGTGISPNCVLDGGQVLHTADLWRRATQCETCKGKGSFSRVVESVCPPLANTYQTYSTTAVADPCLKCSGTGNSWQLTDAKADAATNDGTLLARLAEFARFHYVPTKIVTHRRHAGATHHKPNANP